MPLTPSTRVGPYEIVSSLGAGGMGEVYRAHDSRLGRDVALKLLPAPFAGDPGRLARLEREARLVAGLNHPNIVVLHSIEEADGLRFITMELVEGETLDRHLPPGGLAIPRVVELGIALAEALAAAHEKGIVHRDLKPANVMITRDGRVKVLDFGLAKLESSVEAGDATQADTVAALSSAGQVIGTVPYMAPEQIRGEAAESRTDLFALGVLIHELTAGTRPFIGATAGVISSAILRDAPPPLTALRADAPPELQHIVARCLEKDPASRFANARDVAEALRRVRHAEGTAAIAAPVAPPGTGRTVAAPPPGPSIAVLPFANLSRDEDNEYFSDGLTEELMNVLGRIRGLRVAARTSSFHFKSKHPTIAEVGAALNVGAVLEGSVRKAGNRVRISVQLVKVADGYPLWSDTMERTLDDIFAVQDDVARAVVAALPGELLFSQPGLATGRGTRNRDAYDAYLEGRFYWNKRSEADARKAIEFFERALALDETFAEAWAGLADAYVTLPFYSLTPTDAAYVEARNAASKALALRPDYGPVIATLAYADMIDLRWPQAEEQYRRAIELAPEDANAHKWYADLLMMTGRSSAASRELRTALELDPLSANIWTIQGEWYWLEGRLDEAMANYRKALELMPTLPLALELATRLCWQRDQIADYFALRERLEAVSPRVAVPTATLREAHARGGRRAVLEAQLSAPVARLLPSDRARWHAELGDLDAAFRDLDDSLAQRELRLPYTTYFGDFATIRKDPRYQELLAKMGVARAQ